MGFLNWILFFLFFVTVGIFDQILKLIPFWFYNYVFSFYYFINILAIIKSLST